MDHTVLQWSFSVSIVAEKAVKAAIPVVTLYFTLFV